jgi:glutaminyl-tRNA synthetase
MEVAAKKWFRLAPGQHVRLKNAYIVKCEGCVKDENGKVTEVHCTYLPETQSGNDNSGMTVKGTIHWVSIPHAIGAELRLYDRLFQVENPANEEGDFKEYMNPDSLQIVRHAWLEPTLANAKPGEYYQFIRKGYFTADSKLSTDGHPVFNRTVTLKDNWQKQNK